MHAKTMEGLAGASMNMKMMNTPFRVYQEAERRGDTSVMERAMGYVGETADKAEDYQKKVEKGMKEKAKSEQENAIQKRKEERGEQEKRIAESRNGNTDTVSISENGKAILGESSDLAQAGTDSGIPVETADAVKTEPVIYTKTGEAVRPKSGTNISVSA